MKYKEINDLIKLTKAPAFKLKTTDDTKKTADINDFIEDLKNKDIRNSKVFMRFYIMYIALVVFYILLFVVNPDKGLSFEERITGLGFIGALLVYVYYFKIAKTGHLKQNYDRPTQEFLLEAKKRYRFWNKKSFILIPALILIDLAASFSFFTNYYPENYNLKIGIIISQCIFIGICFFGFFFGKRNWEKRNRSVYENIVTLINSFSIENTAG